MSTATGEEDQTGVCFRDSRWLELYPLTKDTVLDYFTLSGFYDRSCNNEHLKMQRLGLDKLNLMKGIEYVLSTANEPDLYVITKRKRDSPTSVIPLAVYYIIRGTIFQAPNVYSVVASRTIKCLYHVQKAFQECNSYASFDPYTGYTWDFNKSADKISKLHTVTKENELKRKEDTFRIDKIIGSLMSQFPPPVVPAQLPPTPINQTLKRKLPDTPTSTSSSTEKKIKTS